MGEKLTAKEAKQLLKALTQSEQEEKFVADKLFEKNITFTGIVYPNDKGYGYIKTADGYIKIIKIIKERKDIEIIDLNETDKESLYADLDGIDKCIYDLFKDFDSVFKNF